MGRMLDVFRLAEVKRDGNAAPAPEDEHFVSDFANEEVPFIEVGPARSMEASSAVLAAPPRLRIAPRPPVDAGPILDAGPEVAPPTVCLRPLPAGLGQLPPRQRFAPEIIAFHQPDHPAGVEYRQLAAALRQDGAAPCRVLFCAGVASGAGTTSVVLNLAVCLAGPEGLRVVVVDADPERPAIAERLGLRGRPGLAEVLEGSESLDRALQETGVPRLTVLPAGQPHRDREALPVAEVCRPVLRVLRERFDVVLIDAGAGDGGLGRACDSAYLVAPHAEADTTATVERARALLTRGVPLRGCILTGR